jgi:hypothetical protein
MPNPSARSLKVIADELCAAMQNYAAVLTVETAPEAVIPAMDAVQVLADEFVQLSISETGWGTPFLPSPFDDEDDDEGPTEEDGEIVEMTMSYSIRCVDRGLARKLVDERLRKAGRIVPEDEIDSVQGVLSTLERIDGWNPQDYEVSAQKPFEVLERSWSFR